MSLPADMIGFIENTKSNEKLVEYFLNTPKNQIKSKKDFLRKSVLLSFLLYINHDKDFLIILDNIKDIEFFHDYDYWTWIDMSISLLAYHYQTEGQDELFLNERKKLDDVLNQGKTDLIITVKHNVHKRFLAGESLDESRINSSEESRNDISQIVRRLLFLITVIRLKVYIKESTVDENIINQKIAENTSIISDFISKHGIQKVLNKI